MKNILIKVLKFLGFLSIGVLLMYFAFKGIELNSLIADLKEANYSWVLLSLVMACMAYASRAIRWRLIIEPLGYKAGIRNTFFSLMIGYLANFVFPRIGEITRCATLGKKENIPVDQLVGTVIVERAVDFLSLLAFLTILIIFRFETFGHFFQENIFTPLGEKISDTLNISKVLWISATGLVVLIVAAYLIFREQLSEIKIISKGKNIVKGILDGLKTVYKLKKRGLFLFHTLIIWANYWLMTWVVVFAIPATSGLKIMDGLFLLVIGGLGMSAPIQNGYGAFHWIVSRGLVAVYEGITLKEALVFATLTHESQAILAVLLGTLSFALIFRKKRKTLKLPFLRKRFS